MPAKLKIGDQGCMIEIVLGDGRSVFCLESVL